MCAPCSASSCRAYRAEAHMRVLLVYSNRTRDLILAPPIGLSYVASATHRAGHTVRFLDLLTAPDPDAALDTVLREFAP